MLSEMIAIVLDNLVSISTDSYDTALTDAKFYNVLDSVLQWAEVW